MTLTPITSDLWISAKGFRVGETVDRHVLALPIVRDRDQVRLAALPVCRSHRLFLLELWVLGPGESMASAIAGDQRPCALGLMRWERRERRARSPNTAGSHWEPRPGTSSSAEGSATSYWVVLG